METAIGIKPAHRKESALLLSKILADEVLLLNKTRNAHWNVEGPDFHSKHLFFDSQYEALDEIVDAVAERIRALGHYTPATLKDFLALTHFTEEGGGKNDSGSYISNLLADHESLIIHLRENINRIANDLHDAGTSDFITGLMEKHEAMAWMLRAHLK